MPNKYSEIGELLIRPVGGAELTKICHQAYELSKELGIVVLVCHNDILYEPRLEIVSIGQVSFSFKQPISHGI